MSELAAMPRMTRLGTVQQRFGLEGGYRMNRSLVALAVLALASVSWAQDQDLQQRIKLLEEQNKKILDRLQQSEQRNASLASELNVFKDEQRAGDAGSAIETMVNGMSYDDTNVTWSKLAKSGNPIQFYGFVRMDAYYDQARMNNVHNPFFVQAEGGAQVDRNDDEFAYDVRLTRIGLNWNAGRIGSADVTGKIETDFANSNLAAESRETPRIRIAYMNIDFGDIALRFGQDWDIISPLYPSVNAENLMWNAGNPGDRRPMAEFIWTPNEGDAYEFEIKIGAGLTGAVDNQDLDIGNAIAPTVNQKDGFDSGVPHGQVRIGLSTDGWVAKKKLVFGLFGAVGAMETDVKINGEDDFTSYLVGLDLQIPIFEAFGVRGELFYGQAMGDFRAGIGQSINTTDGEEIESIGGWLEVYWDVTDVWRLHLGGSADDPTDDDVAAGGRELNWTLWLGTIYNFGGGLKAGFDIIYWETQWDTVGIGNTVRFDLYVQLDF
jgi:hypothetical protein